jgi:hypothetical protein
MIWLVKAHACETAGVTLGVTFQMAAILDRSLQPGITIGLRQRIWLLNVKRHRTTAEQVAT